MLTKPPLFQILKGIESPGSPHLLEVLTFLCGPSTANVMYWQGELRFNGQTSVDEASVDAVMDMTTPTCVCEKNLEPPNVLKIVGVGGGVMVSVMESDMVMDCDVDIVVRESVIDRDVVAVNEFENGSDKENVVTEGLKRCRR